MKSLLENVMDLRLNTTTYLMHIPQDEFRKILTNYYNHPKAVVRATASVMNAIYTHGKPTFHITADDFSALVEADKFNLKYKGRKGILNVQKTYCELIELLKKSGEFSVIDDYEVGSFVPILIGLVDEEIIKSMGDQLTIKLASNWHQTAIKIHQELKKTKQIIKTKSDKDKDKDKLRKSDLSLEEEDSKKQQLVFKKLAPVDYDDPSLDENPEMLLANIGGQNEEND